jgi:glutathione S-transferase
MKLYYSPGAGSMASHITIRELNLDVELIRVDVVKEHKTEHGDDFYKINPKGYVPYLAIDEDAYLSEGAAILLYLADQKSEGNMLSPEGTKERYKTQEWLTFVSSELQQIIGSFFIPDQLTEKGVGFLKAKLDKRFAVLDNQLADSEFLTGANFTVADAYAFTIMNWIPAFGLDLDFSSYQNLSVYLNKIGSRESVKVSMSEEGLLK